MSTTPDIDEAIARHCWDRRSRLMYKLRVSVLYHLSRQKHFEDLDHGVSIITAVAATTAFAALYRALPSAEGWTAGLTAAMAIYALVKNPAASARMHAQAASDFRRLLADCERAGEHWATGMCDEFTAKAVELEASEPEVLTAVMADVQNRLNLASGDPNDLVTLRPWQRWLMHWKNFDAAKLAAQR
jgi:hypothetical protein